MKRAPTHTVPVKAHAFRWYVGRDEQEDMPQYDEGIYGTGTNGTIVVESNGDEFWVRREK